MEKSMRIFLVGDYKTGTGPANVTKELLKNLPTDTLFLKTNSKVTRLLEIYWKTVVAKFLVFSGYSRQNIFGMKWARFLGKPAYYLMHGCVEHENVINGVPDKDMVRKEREMLKLAKGILAVSPSFSIWLKAHYPEYKEKIFTLTNGIDWSSMKEGQKRRKEGGEYRILSIGGGMPRKQIVKICQAIHLLIPLVPQKKICLTVLGGEGLDTKAIRSYPFVQYLGVVNEKRVEEELENTNLFIQDSCFETFGLAPIEALLRGCDLLLSRQVGALCILGQTRPEDVIEDDKNEKEIAEKIKIQMEGGNHDRLLSNIDKESTSWKARAKELQDFLTGRG